MDFYWKYWYALYTINVWFIYKRITHVCFPQMRHFESKIMSNDYPSHSLSVVKISIQMVEVLLNNDGKTNRNQHENHILYYHFYSLFLQYLKKGKKTTWDFDWIWKLEERVTKSNTFWFSSSDQSGLKSLWAALKCSFLDTFTFIVCQNVIPETSLCYSPSHYLLQEHFTRHKINSFTEKRFIISFNPEGLT